MPFNEYTNRIQDAIYGSAIGDAFGVPYEFCGRTATHVIKEMKGYGTHEQPAGTFSDDTSMMLATLDSLKENNGKIDIEDIRNKFIAWKRYGNYAINNNVFDMGITISNALASGKGCDGERDNGNGSLMRILPLAFTDCTDKEIEEVSAITHAHRIAKEACVTYIHIAKDLLEGKGLRQAIGDNMSTFPELSRINSNIDNIPEDEISSGGYVVHTLEASLWCLLKTNSYEQCIIKAVSLGHDTDTTACVAGGLAGILYGYENIPKDWQEQLRGRNIIEKCMPK